MLRVRVRVSFFCFTVRSSCVAAHTVRVFGSKHLVAVNSFFGLTVVFRTLFGDIECSTRCHVIRDSKHLDNGNGERETFKDQKHWMEMWTVFIVYTIIRVSESAQMWRINNNGFFLFFFTIGQWRCRAFKRLPARHNGHVQDPVTHLVLFKWNTWMSLLLNKEAHL